MIISQKLIFAAFSLFENATIVILSHGVESKGSRERRPLFSFALRPIVGLPCPGGDRGDTERNLVPDNGPAVVQYIRATALWGWNFSF